MRMSKGCAEGGGGAEADGGEQTREESSPEDTEGDATFENTPANLSRSKRSLTSFCRCRSLSAFSFCLKGCVRIHGVRT